jgi:hypothetical protein
MGDGWEKDNTWGQKMGGSFTVLTIILEELGAQEHPWRIERRHACVLCYHQLFKMAVEGEMIWGERFSVRVYVQYPISHFQEGVSGAEAAVLRRRSWHWRSLAFRPSVGRYGGWEGFFWSQGMAF